MFGMHTTVSTQQISEYINAAMSLLSPASVNTFSQLPSSIGCRNHLFRGVFREQACFLKLRAHERHDVWAELQALDAARDLPSPNVLGALQPHLLLEEAIDKKDLTLIGKLDLSVGEGLFLEALDADAVEEPLDDAGMESLGRLLATLHQTPFPDGPRLKMPSRPSSMLRVIGDQLDELEEAGVLDTETFALCERALDVLEERLDEWDGRWPRVEAFCHGDLRWHNLMSGEELSIVDFEYAGLGDPALDLAMMVTRTPVGWFDELRLLNAYAAHTPDMRWHQRYVFLLPFVGLMGALVGLLDLLDVHLGRRGHTDSTHSFVTRRAVAVGRELQHALKRVLGPLEDVPLPDFAWPSLKNSSFGGVIAIDGTAASLKSPFAGLLASALGISYFDTGAMYRGIALYAHCHDLRPHEEDARGLIEALSCVTLRLLPGGGVQFGEWSLRKSLGAAVVESSVGQWAALPSIRAFVSECIHASIDGHAVVEGRDVGTHLYPDAEFKIFVDAPLDERAASLAARAGLSLEDALDLLRERDERDRQRAIHPLRPAEGAHHIALNADTLYRDVQKIVDILCEEEGRI
ncbi:MAG: hypothetical protein CL920_23000 [Deltaproteobacteria bacterium]|nr:hypothetical protein [Deltaproteobacteria bacterium]|tara:strand:+ start:4029 stop:5759 length:1731 start_codon:yes stop_codon:yes gene_type:complete